MFVIFTSTAPLQTIVGPADLIEVANEAESPVNESDFSTVSCFEKVCNDENSEEKPFLTEMSEFDCNAEFAKETESNDKSRPESVKTRSIEDADLDCSER